jgi:uncharacterized membrane protein HdeD (DUF308 family)
MNEENNKCRHKDSGKLIGGLIVLGLGVIFLLSAYDILNWSRIWPWILIIVGVALIIAYFHEKKQA